MSRPHVRREGHDYHLSTSTRRPYGASQPANPDRCPDRCSFPRRCPGRDRSGATDPWRGVVESGVQGSGVAATQTRAVAKFSSLDLAGSNNVTVTVGGPQSVVVRADSNLLSHVTTRVAAGTLVIGNTGSFTTRSPMSVDVSVPSLTALNLGGDGKISVTGISAPQLTVIVSGSGQLSMAGTATRLDVLSAATARRSSASSLPATSARSSLARASSRSLPSQALTRPSPALARSSTAVIRRE